VILGELWWRSWLRESLCGKLLGSRGKSFDSYAFFSLKFKKVDMLWILCRNEEQFQVFYDLDWWCRIYTGDRCVWWFVFKVVKEAWLDQVPKIAVLGKAVLFTSLEYYINVQSRGILALLGLSLGDSLENTEQPKQWKTQKAYRIAQYLSELKLTRNCFRRNFSTFIIRCLR
jgi:hypothetical protein